MSSRQTLFVEQMEAEGGPPSLGSRAFSEGSGFLSGVVRLITNPLHLSIFKSAPEVSPHGEASLQSLGNHGIRVLASSSYQTLARQISGCAIRLMNLQIVKQANCRSFKRAALRCRAEVEKTRCGCEKTRFINSNNGSRSILPTAAIGRRYCPIVACSRVRRLTEVSLEQGPEASLHDRPVESDLSRNNRCLGDFLDVVSHVYVDRRMGRTFDSSKRPPP